MCPHANVDRCHGHKSCVGSDTTIVTRGTSRVYFPKGHVAVVTRGSSCRGEACPANLRETGSRKDLRAARDEESRAVAHQVRP